MRLAWCGWNTTTSRRPGNRARRPREPWRRSPPDGGRSRRGRGRPGPRPRCSRRRPTPPNAANPRATSSAVQPAATRPRRRPSRSRRCGAPTAAASATRRPCRRRRSRSTAGGPPRHVVARVHVACQSAPSDGPYVSSRASAGGVAAEEVGVVLVDDEHAVGGQQPREIAERLADLVEVAVVVEMVGVEVRDDGDRRAEPVERAVVLAGLGDEVRPAARVRARGRGRAPRRRSRTTGRARRARGWSPRATTWSSCRGSPRRRCRVRPAISAPTQPRRTSRRAGPAAAASTSCGGGSPRPHRRRDDERRVRRQRHRAVAGVHAGSRARRGDGARGRRTVAAAHRVGPRARSSSAAPLIPEPPIPTR